MTDDLPELSREDAVEAMQDMATDLYRAQDRLAFVREMLDTHTGPLTPDRVRSWLDRPVCPRAESEQQHIARLEAAIARVRQYCALADSCRVQARVTVRDELQLLDGAHDHQACERCDVTDPCPCCELRWQDGRWVNADGSPYTAGPRPLPPYPVGGGARAETAWCGASTIIDFGLRPVAWGPCVLRHGHDGPVHQDRGGSTWTALPLPSPRTADNGEAR